MEEPEVSVLMAVYNGRPYLKEAVQSILDQTLGDFEFIIINDGSTDGTEGVLDRFVDRDDRVRLVHQENRGLIESLNRGLDMARGKYVARMDADDIAHPDRLQAQVRFLEANPDVGVLGTQVERIDDSGQTDGKWKFPTDPDQVAWRLLFGTCLCHPSVMMRAALIQDLGGYAAWATHGEDYELWTRALLESRLANLPGTLLKYRRHEETVSEQNREIQFETVGRAASILHGHLLGKRADKEFTKFVVWMNAGWMREDGVRLAMEKTGVDDLAGIQRYVRILYKAYSKRIAGEPNMKARNQAIIMQDMMCAERTESVSVQQKVSSRLLDPKSELLKWTLGRVRDKYDKESDVG
ncbi:glycosyltransferase involved in cell wall biosynthesis [Salinibacter ruber]|uniref:glycosyltransferase family 2 protein n=1 Tax=Salinibacter ruber TaxID=146919 RepID=UPI00216A6B0C|nr:glycosyltransferase [Salinibacter ruber]MCS3668067.1 glycosyltransferase involved in cell wall biosynthesis [Salinibacter ruber]